MHQCIDAWMDECINACIHPFIYIALFSFCIYVPASAFMSMPVSVCLSVSLPVRIYIVTLSFFPSTFCPRSLCNSTKYPHSRADKLIRHLHALSSPHTLIPHISIRIPSPSPPPSPPQHKANDDDFKISKLRGSILRQTSSAGTKSLRPWHRVGSSKELPSHDAATASESD